MGGAGAAMAMQAVVRLSNNIMGSVGGGVVHLHMGKPVVKDVPLLISALKIHDQATRDDAHMWLTKLAEADLGLDPVAWENWWALEKPRLERKEADESAAQGIFDRLRNDLVLGRWDDVHGTLCRGLRVRRSAQVLAEELQAAKQMMRAAFRDASVLELKLEKAKGVLEVDWGKRGFETDQLDIIREDGEWRFATVPWQSNLITRRTDEPKLHYHKPGRQFHAKREHSLIAVVSLFWLIGVIFVAPVVAILTGNLLLTLLAGGMTGPVAVLFVQLTDSVKSVARRSRRRKRR